MKLFNKRAYILTISAFLFVSVFSVFYPIKAEARSFTAADFFDPLNLFHDDDDDNDKVINNYYYDGGQDNNPQNSSLNVSCYSSPSTIDEGDSAVWNAQVSGGTGNYTYSWSGTDGLSGSGSSAYKTYDYAGTKHASVYVTSGSKSISVSCSNSLNVKDAKDDEDDLRVSCYGSPSRVEIDEEVTWRVNASGGDGDYDYDWDGTDDLRGSGRDIDWEYDDEGTKRATVTVRSGNQTVTESCGSIYVEEDEDDYDESLTGSCYPDYSSAYVGQSVTWRVDAQGGTGSYSYDWSGTDNLDGSYSSISKYYNRTGSKTASVKIKSGSRSITRQCGRVEIFNKTNYVESSPIYNSGSLAVSCSASPTNTKVNEPVVWSAKVYGGTGSYSYTWSGSDGLSSSQSSTVIGYSYAGTKNASVTVRSGSDVVTQACSNSAYVTAYTSSVSTSKTNTSNTSNNEKIDDGVELSAAASYAVGKIPWTWILLAIIIILLTMIAYLVGQKDKK